MDDLGRVSRREDVEHAEAIVRTEVVNGERCRRKRRGSIVSIRRGRGSGIKGRRGMILAEAEIWHDQWAESSRDSFCSGILGTAWDVGGVGDAGVYFFWS
jgi:hypothetical protein